VAEQPPKTSAPPGGPPRLERVPTGYRPPPVARPAGPEPAPAPKSGYGLAERQVGADAAMAAGLAQAGALASDGTLRLFYLAAATQASGRLVLALDGKELALTFRRGTVEHAASSDPADDLGGFLLRKGALTAEQLAQAEAARAPSGGDLVGTLIAQRLVNPADVAGHLQAHGAALVAQALAAEAGSWAWEPNAAPPPSSFPLGSPWAMLCAGVRGLDAAAVQRRLGDRERRAASRIGGRIRVEDLRLTPQETRAVGLFDGRSAAEIALASAADASIVLRLALLLGETELLSFGPLRAAPPPAAARAPATPTANPTVASTATASPTATANPTANPTATASPTATANTTATSKPAARPPPPPAQPRPAAPPAAKPPPPKQAAPAPAPPPPAALDAATLRAHYEKIKAADHFAVLGVKRDATGAQVKIAYFQLAKAYHPDAVPASAPPEVKKLCADVFAKVSEAWGALGDDGKRAAYLKDLESGAADKVDVTSIFHAEELFQAGTSLVKTRRYEEALAKFDAALKLYSDEPEFGMWQAWCEFLIAEDKRSRHGTSASAIEAGLKRNPNCAQGYLFLGQMAKLVGDAALAERHFKRGLAVAPNHAMLARELKYLRK